MSAVKTILIGNAERPLTSLFRQAVFWGVMIGAVGLSRAWFGGAWIVDISAFMLACVAVAMFVAKAGGTYVEASVEDIKAWADAGAPRDMRAWLVARKGFGA